MAVQSSLTHMVVALGLTCLLCSAILGGAYVLTKEPIDNAVVQKTNKAVSQVLPAFENASARAVVKLSGRDFPYYAAKNGETLVGYAIESTVVGFGGNLSVMVGITPDRVVCNTAVLSHSETPGLGAKCTADQKFAGQWKGFNPAVKKLSLTQDGGDIDAITASTITSRAYALAVENALAAFDEIHSAAACPQDDTCDEESVKEGGKR